MERFLTPHLSLRQGGWGAPAPGTATIMEAPKSSEDNGALVLKTENKDTRGWVGITNRMSLETLLQVTERARQVSPATRHARGTFASRHVRTHWPRSGLGFARFQHAPVSFLGGPKFLFHPTMSQHGGPGQTAMSLKMGCFENRATDRKQTYVAIIQIPHISDVTWYLSFSDLPPSEMDLSTK